MTYWLAWLALACMLVVCRHVWRLADRYGGLTVTDEPGPPPPEPTPLDDMPPDNGVDWDDFTLRLELWALTERTAA